MGIKKRVRKAPITSLAATGPSGASTTGPRGPTATTTARQSSTTTNAKRSRSKSSRQTQSIISTYHTLLKRRKQLLAANDPDGVAQVDQEIEEMGGLDAYQKASQMGQTKERGGDSGRVLVPWLEEMGWGVGGKGRCEEGYGAEGKGQAIEGGEGREEQKRQIRTLRMLEIGAVRPDNYAAHRWIHNTPIDINSQHPLILQQDFFDRPLPSSSSPLDAFDIVSCSLVLNFVDDPFQRGRMLRLIHSHLRPSPSSLVFLVLPLPCVNNSRYLDRERLIAIMRTIGFKMEKERWKPENKVGYWLWSWQAPAASIGPSIPNKDSVAGSSKSTRELHRKVILRDGPGYNNFAICL